MKVVNITRDTAIHFFQRLTIVRQKNHLRRQIYKVTAPSNPGIKYHNCQISSMARNKMAESNPICFSTCGCILFIKGSLLKICEFSNYSTISAFVLLSKHQIFIILQIHSTILKEIYFLSIH